MVGSVRGQDATFVITANDRFGNRVVGVGGDAFVARMELASEPTSQALAVVALLSPDGAPTGQFQVGYRVPSASQDEEVSIVVALATAPADVVGGSSAPGRRLTASASLASLTGVSSPFAARVAAVSQPFSAEMSTVEGSGMAGGQAGSDLELRIQTYDTAGIPLPAGGRSLSVLLDALSPASGSVVDVGGGAYLGTYAVTVSGVYSLAVHDSLAGALGDGVFPREVVISPGPSAACSLAVEVASAGALRTDGGSSGHVAAGEAFALSARCVDAFGNAQVYGPANPSDELTATAANTPLSLAFPLSARFSGDGYILAGAVTAAGVYQIELRLDGSSTGAPFELVVHSGRVDPELTKAYGAGLRGR